MIRLNRPVAGWIFYDFANSAFATTVLAVIFNRYFAEVVAGGPAGTTFHLFGAEFAVPGAALWSFLVAVSTVLVAVSSPLLGAMADRAGWRRRMLVIYCYLGVAATAALSLAGEGDVWLGGLLFIGANLGFAGGNVFYNAFLLDIGRRETYGRISGAAWGMGYLGGGLCLGLNLIMLERPQLLGFPEGTFNVGHCVIAAGLWWGLFALPTMLWLKEGRRSPQRISVVRLTAEGWQQLKRTLNRITRYKQLLRFLIAYLIFTDGIDTVIVMASIFGAEVVGMGTGELVLYFLMVQGTALVGSLFFGWLADRAGNKRTLLITIAIWIGVVVWGYKLGWLFDPKTDFYLLGVAAGSVLGGSQSIARALQASFTPRDQSAEFFGFYAVSGRFASIFGPLTFFAAIMITGGIQTGIIALGAFFVIGGAILWTVNEASGIRAASNSHGG